MTKGKAAAVCDPLRDTNKLVQAATQQALKLQHDYNKKKKDFETMSAMDFCRLVLNEGLGLADFGVGQRQRIVISKTRKEVLGKLDGSIIKAPPKAEKCELPSSGHVYEQLSKEFSNTKNKDYDPSSRIKSAFDADTLKKTGILHMPEILSNEDILELLKYLSEVEDKQSFKWTNLRSTTGNGQFGAYATLPNKVPTILDTIQSELKQVLKTELNVDSGDKPIFLKYGERGINWAHQDQSAFPYQAMLLLSRPGIDFQGGKLYVCDPSTPSTEKKDDIVRHEVEWKSQGDLVIFAANDTNVTSQPFYHGMTKIEEGTKQKGQDCHRLAIGMLQT